MDKHLPRSGRGFTPKSVPEAAPSGKPKLLDEVRALLRAKYYAIRTEETYLGWIRRFILFSGKRHPKEMGGREVAAFLSHLANDGNVSPSTQNQAFSALLFLYNDFLEQPLDDLGPVTRAQRERKAPVVLTKEEVKRLLAQLEGTDWIMAMLLYGSGLRLLEMLRLRVKDIDFGYGQITIRDGKGGKDRVTMLPEGVTEALQRHLEPQEARTPAGHPRGRRQRLPALRPCLQIPQGGQGVGLAVCVCGQKHVS
jgi:integrase